MTQLELFDSDLRAPLRAEVQLRAAVTCECRTHLYGIFGGEPVEGLDGQLHYPGCRWEAASGRAAG